MFCGKQGDEVLCHRSSRIGRYLLCSNRNIENVEPPQHLGRLAYPGDTTLRCVVFSIAKQQVFADLDVRIRSRQPVEGQTANMKIRAFQLISETTLVQRKSFCEL